MTCDFTAEEWAARKKEMTRKRTSKWRGTEEMQAQLTAEEWTARNKEMARKRKRKSRGGGPE